MLSRCLLTRSLSASLRTRVCSRSLSSLRFAQPASSFTSLRQFSAAPAFRTENQLEPRTHEPPSGTCYISNIPYKVTAEQLKDALEEFGQVESVKLLTTDAGVSRGCGFVRFESVAGAVNFVEAHEADPVFVLDRQIHVRHTQQKRNVPTEPSDTLLLFDAAEESELGVRTMFGSYAEMIRGVRFHQKKGDKLVFIQFRNVDVAMEAMDTFRNQNGDIRIEYARQRQTPAKQYTLTSRRSHHPDT